jgi:hypothetical protein
MEIVALDLIGIVLAFLGIELIIKLKKARPLIITVSRQNTAPAGLNEKQNIVPIPTLHDVIPEPQVVIAPQKVIHFPMGKGGARLVMHGPISTRKKVGFVTRHLFLWKGDKYRCISLSPLNGIRYDSLTKVYEDSLVESEEIAKNWVYGKKDKSSKEDAGKELLKPEALATPPPASLAPVIPVVVAVPVPSVVTTAPVTHVTEVPDVAEVVHQREDFSPQGDDKPVTKGFIKQIEGELVSAGFEKQIRIERKGPDKGKRKEYEAYTVTLCGPDGRNVTAAGVDLERALIESGAVVGDHIRVCDRGHQPVEIKEFGKPKMVNKNLFSIFKTAKQQ